MMDERDPFDYQLTEALGWRSVAAMREGIGYGEYLQWRAFYTWRNAKQQLNEKHSA